MVSANSLVRSISRVSGVCFFFFFFFLRLFVTVGPVFNANSFVASDLGLHSLSMSILWGVRHIWIIVYLKIDQ